MRRFRWLLAAVVVLVVVVAGATVVVLRTRDGSTCDLPDTTPDVRSAPAGSAPGGGGVEVVENGFSAVPDGLSMAVVVRNTSTTHTAYRTRIGFTPAGRNWFGEIPVLLPGQRLGVASRIPSAVTPSAPEILIGQTHWLDAGTRPFEPVTAAYQDDTQVRVTSPYCRDVARHGVVLLFRDATGKLLGGTRTEDGPDAVCRPGARTETGPPIQDRPAGADPGRTEAYAYCDTAAVDRTPAGPAGVNYRYS